MGRPHARQASADRRPVRKRQSRELLRRCSAFRDADPAPPRIVRANLTELEADNGGRIICVPATDQARGFTCDTLVVEEACIRGG